MDDLIIKIFTPLISTFLGAYLAYILSLTKGKKEKIWLRKHEAYMEIIDSLHEVYIWGLQKEAALMPNFGSRSSEQLKELSISKDKALDILSKYSHVGILIISEGASKMLEETLKEYYSNEIYYNAEIAIQGDFWEKAEYYGKLHESFRHTISRIKDIARSELGIKELA